MRSDFASKKCDEANIKAFGTYPKDSDTLWNEPNKPPYNLNPWLRGAYYRERERPGFPEIGSYPLKAPVIIAIIDDEENIRRGMSGLLRSLGYEARSFESAEAFLATTAAGDCSCIVSDVHMDGMSGIDLLRAIRSVPELNQIKIIMATSERSVDKMDEATSNGADHYVVKPYELRDLEVRVKKVLAC